MNNYKMFVRVDGTWKPLAEILASTHSDALRQAMSRLEPEHYNKPIRIEQVIEEVTEGADEKGP